MGRIKIYYKYQLELEFGECSGKSNNRNEAAEIIRVKQIIASEVGGDGGFAG